MMDCLHVSAARAFLASANRMLTYYSDKLISRELHPPSSDRSLQEYRAAYHEVLLRRDMVAYAERNLASLLRSKEDCTLHT